MAVESLFDRCELADWREFDQSMRLDVELAKSALTLAKGHEDGGSATSVRILIEQCHSTLIHKLSMR